MSDLDILRRIAESGLKQAQSRQDDYVDLFQHMLDEIKRIPDPYKENPIFQPKEYKQWYEGIWKQEQLEGCLHDSCSVCNGTGIRKDGLGVCIHGLSCPCPKHTIR